MLFLFMLVMLVTGCGAGKKKSDGFYGGDSAPDAGGRNFDDIPDAVPRYEPLSKTGNNPYTALGKSYRPMKSAENYEQIGIASWYGKKFHGRRTSSGEPYDMWAMTAAHPVLPLPSYVEVTNLDTGKVIVVKVNDRGPFLHNRIIDLSFAAAHKLGIANHGTGRVRIRTVVPQENQVFQGTAGSAALTQPDQPENSGYLIQVGAYSNSTNSMAMRDQLAKRGYTLYPENDESHVSSGNPYRVQVGPVSSMEKALKIKHELEQLVGQTLLLIAN